MAERERVVVKSPSGGWPPPWPSVAELAAALSSEHWTLIGGLMTQLQALHHGVDAVRPTNDIDILVHVETGTGKPARVAAALTTLGYVLQPSIDRRRRTAHRFVRGRQTVDLVASPPSDVVDVLVADHAPPRVRESLGGHQMVEVEGGTQALRRTMIMVATIAGDSETALSVPDPFGALILKAAAHKADSRDPDRHLQDAAALLACVDPFEARTSSGGDRARLLYLQRCARSAHLRRTGAAGIVATSSARRRRLRLAAA